MATQNKKQSLSSMLIRGAGDVTNKATQIVSAANRPSYNPSAQNNLNQGIIQANRFRKMEQYRNDQTVKAYINQIPTGFDTSQLTQADRAVAEEAIAGFRREAVENITKYLSGAYDPGQPEYDQAIKKIGDIKSRIRVMEQGFKNYGQGRTEFLKDYSDKNFSSANDLSNMSNLSNLFTDKIPVQIDPNTGNPTWAGKTYNEHMANQPFNKAYEEAGKYTNFAQKMYGAGVPMNEATRTMYGNEINLMLDKGGWEATRSLVKDNILGDSFLKDKQQLVDQLIEQGNSQDPNVAYEAREQLNSILKERMLDNLDEMAKKGMANNASKVKDTAGDSNILSLNNDGTSGIDNWLSTNYPKAGPEPEGPGVTNEDKPEPYPNGKPTADDWNMELMDTDFAIQAGEATYTFQGVAMNESQLLERLKTQVGNAKYQEFINNPKENQNILTDAFPGISRSKQAYVQYLGGNADQRRARQFPVDLADPEKISALLKRLNAKTR